MPDNWRGCQAVLTVFPVGMPGGCLLRFRVNAGEAYCSGLLADHPPEGTDMPRFKSLAWMAGVAAVVYLGIGHYQKMRQG